MEIRITELLLNKYKTLYNSIPTAVAELSNIKDTVNGGIINHQSNKKITVFAHTNKFIVYIRAKWGHNAFNIHILL